MSVEKKEQNHNTNEEPEDSANRISLFILKAQAGSLSQAENYLRNRDVFIESTINLRDALVAITQSQPQYVIITSDHPNSKVLMLPKLLQQAFPQIKVIGLSEKGNGISTKNLLVMGLEYNLYPPTSGPAIERMILRIKKDEETKSQAAVEISKDPRSSGYVAVKGGANSPNSSPEQQSSFERARQILGQMISAETASMESSSNSAAGPRAGKATSSTESALNQNQVSGSSSNTALSSGIAYMPDGSSSESQNASSQGSNPNDLYARMEQALAMDLPATGTDSTSAADSMENTSISMTQNNSSMSLNSDSLSPDSSGRAPSHRNLSPSNQATENEVAEDFNNDKVRTKSQHRANLTRLEKLAGEPSQSALAKATEEALNQLSNSDVVKAIGTVEQMVCLKIQTSTQTGYLSFAFGSSALLPDDIIETLRKSLMEYSANHRQSFRIGEPIAVEIDPVDFKSWALDQAEFLKTAEAMETELAVAFFSSFLPQQTLESSASEEMVQIEMKDLKADIVLDFDIYIYMPENKKFLLYTPKGRPFNGRQRERLTEKGITHMHLRKDASQSVLKYVAQIFLNGKIRAFYEKSKN